MTTDFEARDDDAPPSPQPPTPGAFLREWREVIPSVTLISLEGFGDDHELFSANPEFVRIKLVLDYQGKTYAFRDALYNLTVTEQDIAAVHGTSHGHGPTTRYIAQLVRVSNTFGVLQKYTQQYVTIGPEFPIKPWIFTTQTSQNLDAVVAERSRPTTCRSACCSDMRRMHSEPPMCRWWRAERRRSKRR
jgi:hypothetical protein